jgi:hypothetical protein
VFNTEAHPVRILPQLNFNKGETISAVAKSL